MNSSQKNNETPRERLLVVEDDTYLREEIMRILQRRTKFSVTAAADGEEALKLAESEHFDVLITDVRMPGIDGIELLERLKEQRPELVSIIITAFADEQATIRALKLGANDYIRKPFSITDLVNAIERQVTVVRLRHEAETSRKLMEGLVSSMTTGVLALDREACVAAVNKRAEEILEIPADRLIGHELLEAFAGADESRTEDVLGLLNELERRGETTLEREMTVRQAGLPITYRLAATRIQSVRGDHLGVVVLFNDVSELIQAQKLNAWKDLARTVAHEIKNPLTPIKLSAQQLVTVRNSDEEKLREQLDIAVANIIKNADRLDTLAREFSRFGRLPKEEMATVDISEVVTEALATIKTDEFIEIEKDIAESLPPVLGDRGALIRMVANLLSNAIEAMPKGGKLVLKTTNIDGKKVRITVADTGEGIPDEVRESLFRPYVTSKAHGTGLGLVVVKEVVNRHSGTINVRSDAGVGTTFEILLPTREA